LSRNWERVEGGANALGSTVHGGEGKKQPSPEERPRGKGREWPSPRREVYEKIGRLEKRGRNRGVKCAEEEQVEKRRQTALS